MGRKPSLIEINQQLYDANSGRLFHHPRGPVIDGFMKKPQHSRVIKKVAATIAPTSFKATPAKSHQHRPAQTVHKRTQRSNTLMRSIVKRPGKKNSLSSKLIRPKARTGMPSPARVSRAMNMMKSARVDRFGYPVAHAKTKLAQLSSKTKSTIDGSAVSGKSSTSTAVALRPPSMITSVSHQRLERMLDEALIRADAHKKALSGRLPGKGRFGRRFKFLPRWLTISIAVLVVVSAGSYFAWRNIPYVSMKFASLRTQVKGSLPDYIPSGFKFAGPIEYEPGTISMTFKAEGERYFTLEQKASSWDSSSLEANAILDDSQVQTSQVKGSTVYVDSSNGEATWVSDGKRYKLRGQLNPDEIFKIAGSIL